MTQDDKGGVGVQEQMTDDNDRRTMLIEEKKPCPNFFKVLELAQFICYMADSCQLTC